MNHNSEKNQDPSWSDYLKALPQNILPHHLLSSIMYKVMRNRNPLIKNWITNFIIKKYNVDISEALDPDLNNYPHFNSFFTRELKTGSRPIVAGANNIACPVDGTVSQAGNIEYGRIFQAKGRDYTLLELIGGSQDNAALFNNGSFATLYLSPRDYHRIHCPADAQLREMIHVPGRLFSVSPSTTRVIPALFARNERVVCLFDTAHGPMAVILVGAIFVSSMDTVWAGTITPPGGKKIRNWKYGEEKEYRLKKGDELGRFNMGSTVIVLFGENKINWAPDILPGNSVKMGQLLAEDR